MPVGYLILFLAITADSVNVILTRKYVIYTPAERVYVMSIFGTVLFIPLALAEHAASGTVTEYLTLPFRSTGFLSAILYLGVVTTAVGFTLNAFAIRYLGPNKLVSFSGICTFTSIFAGVMFLHETFTVLQVAGTALILFGAWNANRGPAGGRETSGANNNREQEEER